MDFDQTKLEGATIWSRPDLTFAVHNGLFDSAWIRQNTTVQGAGLGRGQAIIFRHADTSMVYRHYRRGGLLGRINKECYLRGAPMQSRGYQELALLSHMSQQHLPVPTPIAARFNPKGIIYRADILIEEIPNTVTFLDALQNDTVGQRDWAELGRVIATFHAHGIDHTDLNIRNILLDQDGKFWLIDFDKCSQRASGDWTQSNLARLKRSVEKEHAKYHFARWSNANWQALMDQYRAEITS